MLLDDHIGGDAANPLQPVGFEALMMLVGVPFAVPPIVLLVVEVVLPARWIRASRQASV